MPRNLAILLFHDVELLDFCGPYEVFSSANNQVDDPAFGVFTVAESIDPIQSRNRLSVIPHFTLVDCPQPDILLIPGGIGTRKEIQNKTLIDWISQTSIEAEMVLSVCTGRSCLEWPGC